MARLGTYKISSWAFISLFLVALVFTLVIAEEDSQTRENLLRHQESLKIVTLLDKILAKLKDELEGKQHNQHHNIQDISLQITEAQTEKVRLSTQLSEADNRLEYLKAMKQNLEQDAGDNSRSLLHVNKEIELIQKIKKVLLGSKLSSQCSVSEDCGSEYICDAGHCRVPIDGACAASFECVAAAECLYGKCTTAVDRSCEVDADCATGTVCYDFKCKIDVGDQCSSDDQCYTQICEERRCKALEKDMCISSLDCQAGSICEDHRCLLGRGQRCSTHSDCATSYCASPDLESDDKICTTDPCRGVSCAQSRVCDPFEGACLVPAGGHCTNSTDCSSGLSCFNDKCLASLNHGCVASEHCSAGLCYNGRCKLPSNSDTKCESDYDCAFGVCDGDTETCMPGPYSYFDLHKVQGTIRVSHNSTWVETVYSSSATGSALMETSNSKGRWYFEITCIDSVRNCLGAYMGIAEHGTTSGVSGRYYGYRPYGRQTISNVGTATYGDNNVGKGDVFGVDVDFDENRIRFSRNGEFFGWQTNLQPGVYFPAVWDADSGSNRNMNMSINTGFADFVYEPPAKANHGWFGGLLLSQCFSDYECSGNLVCRNAQCKLPVGDYCIHDESCETSHCTQNKCLYHLGEVCSENLQCASGICRNRLCSVGSTTRLNLRSQMGNMEISESRTRVSTTTSTSWTGTVLGEVGNEAGKWYYEVECIGDCRGIRFGIASHTGSSQPSQRFVGYYPRTGILHSNQGSLTYTAGLDMGDKDIAGVYVDLDNNRIGFTMNGMWKGWSNAVEDGLYFPAIWDSDTSYIADVRINFGHYSFAHFDNPEFHRGWFGGSILSTCRSNVNCEGHLTCHEARCRYPLRNPCSSDNECSTPWCFNNKCMLKAGDYCTYGDECATGRCSHGRCSTRQFTTFEPTTAAGSASLSAGFTEVDTLPTGSVLANTANTYGKWYYEVECMSANCYRLAAGVATDIGTTTPGGNYYAFSFNYRCESSPAGTRTFTSTSVTDGDIIGIAVDLENGKIGYYHNGDWLGWCYENIQPNHKYYPSIYDSYSSRPLSAMVNFGYYRFKYQVPSGFNPGWFGGRLLSSCEESEDNNSPYGCDSGLMCYQGFCRLPPAESCKTDDECSTNSCYNHKCVHLAGDRCESDQACATGICENGRCSTGNYAVWNPRMMIGEVVTTDVTHTMAKSSTSSVGVMLGTLGKTHGKYYYEVECMDNCRAMRVGISTATGTTVPNGKYMGFSPYSRAMFYPSTSQTYGSFSGNSDGEILGIYVDLDNHRMGVTQRNQWMGWFQVPIQELDEGEAYFPAVWDYHTSYHFEIRTNFGYYEWRYEVEDEFAHGWI